MSRSLDEFESKRLLSAAGVPCVAEVLASSAAEAEAAAAAIGYPVVLKACGADFPHKTELGLVATGLADAQQVRDAAARIAPAVEGRGKLLVQRHLAGRREFLAGMTRDPQFGPVVTFGLGGIFAEALADVSLRLCPLARVDALAMLQEIRAGAMLGAVRGMPPVDRQALAGVLLALSRLALERPDIEAIDINPLLVTGAQPVAVDALVILSSP